MADISQRLSRRDGRTFYLDIQLPVGPWDNEPDHVDFEHAGFPCILHRGPQGAWCGYVAVPPGHPWHGKGYDEVRLPDRIDDEIDRWPDVHGGLTYASECQGSICHVAKPGEPDDVWWLGFDCNHHGDASLSDEYFSIKYRNEYPFDRRHNGEYRTVDYVRSETERLARQAKECQP